MYTAYQKCEKYLRNMILSAEDFDEDKSMKQ